MSLADTPRTGPVTRRSTGVPAAPRVAVVQERVVHYRRDFYELLRQRLEGEGIELLLVHSNPPREEDVWQAVIEIPWSYEVPARKILIGRRELVWQRCWSLLRSCDLVIVEQGSRHLLNYLLLARQATGGARVALWGHGRNLNRGQESRLGEAVKRRSTRRAHWWFAYNDLAAEIVAALGVPPERITSVQNTVDTRRLGAAVDALSDDDVARTREQLGVSGKHVGLYLGGLSPEKRLTYLFDASDAIRAAVPDFELVIAGSGTEEAHVREFSADRAWVHHLGRAVYGPEKVALLAAADVFLMPCWAGLAVLDSFAAALPMIISGSQAHPPEASYLEDGVNGLVVADHGDAGRYGRAVADLLVDSARLEELRIGCREAAERYTLEEMVERFADGVRRAVGALGPLDGA
jgi:glycosyltransferase involved in cell wall biosynthesis